MERRDRRRIARMLVRMARRMIRAAEIEASDIRGGGSAVQQTTENRVRTWDVLTRRKNREALNELTRIVLTGVCNAVNEKAVTDNSLESMCEDAKKLISDSKKITFESEEEKKMVESTINKASSLKRQWDDIEAKAVNHFLYRVNHDQKESSNDRLNQQNNLLQEVYPVLKDEGIFESLKNSNENRMMSEKNFSQRSDNSLHEINQCKKTIKDNKKKISKAEPGTDIAELSNENKELEERIDKLQNGIDDAKKAMEETVRKENEKSEWARRRMTELKIPEDDIEIIMRESEIRSMRDYDKLNWSNSADPQRELQTMISYHFPAIINMVLGNEMAIKNMIDGLDVLGYESTEISAAFGKNDLSKYIITPGMMNEMLYDVRDLFNEQLKSFCIAMEMRNSKQSNTASLINSSKILLLDENLSLESDIEELTKKFAENDKKIDPKIINGLLDPMRNFQTLFGDQPLSKISMGNDIKNALNDFKRQYGDSLSAMLKSQMSETYKKIAKGIHPYVSKIMAKAIAGGGVESEKGIIAILTQKSLLKKSEKLHQLDDEILDRILFAIPLLGTWTSLGEAMGHTRDSLGYPMPRTIKKSSRSRRAPRRIRMAEGLDPKEMEKAFDQLSKALKECKSLADKASSVRSEMEAEAAKAGKLAPASGSANPLGGIADPIAETVSEICISCVSRAFAETDRKMIPEIRRRTMELMMTMKQARQRIERQLESMDEKSLPTMSRAASARRKPRRR